MKKFFTMLGVAALTAIASQAQDVSYPGNPQFGGFKQNPLELFQTNKVSSIQDVQTQKKVIKREWATPNYTYFLTIQNYARLIDAVQVTFPDASAPGGNRPATFDELPYYIVLMRIQRLRNQGATEQNSTDINLLMTWPSIASSNPSVDKQNFPEFTPENRAIAPVELVASRTQFETDTQFINFNYAEGTQYYAYNYLPGWTQSGEFLGWPQCGNQAEAPITINGKSGYVVVDNGTQHSYLDIQSAKDDNDLQMTTIKMEMNMYYAPQDDNTQTVAINGTYDGTADTYNMVPFNAVYDINEFHLFNSGIVSSKGMDEEQFPNPFGYPDVESFKPIQQYYIMAMPSPLTLGYSNQYGEVKGFNGRQITYAFTDEKDAENPVNYRWIRGAFWTDSESFENQRYDLKSPSIYDLKDPILNQTFQILCASPEANIMLPAGYTTEFGYWPESAGVSTGWLAYNHFPGEPTYLAFNTADGIVFNGTDNGGNTYKMAYKGKVIYHYDSENMNNVREIGPLTGTFNPDNSGVNDIVADSNFTLTAANGVISVASEGENIRVFDLSGALVGSAKGSASFNVNKGLYIVVVGKTAKKVIL